MTEFRDKDIRKLVDNPDIVEELSNEELIRINWRATGKIYPNQVEAFLWALTEMGEVAELLLHKSNKEWKRTHPLEAPDYDPIEMVHEMGDVILMLLIVSMNISGPMTPIEAMRSRLIYEILEVIDADSDL
jgi:hypothetical protein